MSQNLSTLRGRQAALRRTSNSSAIDVNMFNQAGLTNKQCDALNSLTAFLPSFGGIADRLKKLISSGQLKHWLASFAPETDVPTLWDKEKFMLTEIGVAMQQLLIVQALKPDRLITKARRVIGKVLGANFPAATSDGNCRWST